MELINTVMEITGRLKEACHKGFFKEDHSLDYGVRAYHRGRKERKGKEGQTNVSEINGINSKENPQ